MLMAKYKDEINNGFPNINDYDQRLESQFLVN